MSVNPVDYKKIDMVKSQEVTKEKPVILGYDASGVVV